jgi:hypothetical protein
MSRDRARLRVSPWALAILLLSATFLSPVATGAQTPEEVRAFYVPTTPLDDDEESLRFAGIIDEALRRELGLLGLELVVSEQGEPTSLGGSVEAGREADATIVVGSTALVERRELVMTFRVIDVASERLIEAAFSPTLVGVTVHNRIDEAVTDLARRLEEFLANPEERASIAPFALSVTLFGAPEGMAVSYPGSEPLGFVRGGELELPFEPYPVGSRLLLEKTHPGYHSDEETVELTSPRNTFDLDPLWKETVWAGEAFWTTGQLAGLGLGVRYYLQPDYWFLAGENYFYMQLSPYENANPVAHNDIQAWTGRYLLFDYDSSFRFGVGAGLGVILTRVFEAENFLFTDFYLNLLTIWLEYNTRSWTYFFRMSNKISLGIGNHLLGAGYMSVYDPTSDGDFEMPAMTVGVGRKF